VEYVNRLVNVACPRVSLFAFYMIHLDVRKILYDKYLHELVTWFQKIPQENIK